MTGYAWIVLLGMLLSAPGAPAPARGGVRLTPVQTLYDGTGLHEVDAVVASPDGRHVYAAGADNALVAFSRDPATGLLIRVQVSRDVGGVDGLRRVSSLAMSPDGAHVYATGGSEDALAVFARDSVTGLLQFVEVLRDEAGPIDVLGDFTGSIAVSPDGAHVYVSGFDAVTAFSRDPVSGALFLVETRRGLDGVGDADAIAVSPDGKHVYVGGFSDDVLVIFTRDPQRGTLIPGGLLRDGVDGADGLGQVRGISISPDGRNLYVAASDDDSIAVFDRDPDSGLLAFAQILSDGSGSVLGLDGAHSVAVSSDGRRVYAAALGSSALVVFERDATTGRLAFVDAFVDGEGEIDGLDGALHVAISPDSAHVYVAGLFDDAIAIFAGGTAPRFLAVERGIEGSVDGLRGAQAAALSPGGEHLYVAGVTDGAIAVFTRDAATGRLAFVETYAGENRARLTRPSLAVTADGAHLLAAASEPGVSVLRRNPATGRLSLVQRIDQTVDGTDFDTAVAVLFASAVASGPDGEQVFVTSLLRDTLAVFDRQPATGELRFRTALGDEINGPDAPTSIAVTSDGMYVYTTGSSNDTVVAFRYSPTSGGLEFAQVVRDGIDGVVGLRAATSLALSPDESTLYVVSGGPFELRGPLTSDALAVFERNRSDGRLSFVQALADGVGGVDGMAGASSVAVLPDGSAVFVAAPVDNALAVFARDPTSGRVTFARAVRDGDGNADGLAGATSVVVSPDGRYLYVTGSVDNAVTVFRVTDEETICPGDCSADGSVSIGELILCVNIALGRRNLAECSACDARESGAVGIDDLIRAVASSLNGCSNG